MLTTNKLTALCAKDAKNRLPSTKNLLRNYFSCNVSIVLYQLIAMFISFVIVLQLVLLDCVCKSNLFSVIS